MVLENLIGQVGILEAARGEYNGVYVIIIIINVVRAREMMRVTFSPCSSALDFWIQFSRACTACTVA